MVEVFMETEKEEESYSLLMTVEPGNGMCGDARNFIW